jgi:hypothetical protein
MRRLWQNFKRKLTALVDDLAPELGGNLDTNSKEISDSGGQIKHRTMTLRSDTADNYMFSSSDAEIQEESYTIQRQIAANDTPGDGSELYLQRARNELGVPTAPQDGDILGAVFWAGHTGSGWGSAGSIQCYADGNHSSGSTPGDLRLSTSPSGSTTLQTRMYIGQEGNIRQYKGRRITGDVSPSQITGNEDDYNPTDLGTAAVLRLDSDGDYNITGITAQDSGRLIHIYNIGSNTLTLTNEDASSSAANRFALSGDIALAGNDGVSIWYDGTSSRWRALSNAGGAPSP